MVFHVVVVFVSAQITCCFFVCVMKTAGSECDRPCISMLIWFCDGFVMICFHCNEQLVIGCLCIFLHGGSPHCHPQILGPESPSLAPGMQKRATSGAGDLLAQGWQDVQAPRCFKMVNSPMVMGQDPGSTPK